ncbi:MAG: hypothetical protein MJZ68_01460 [archaeon]|jgi:tetrahydrodipicolinate N-succinyltransferase|nr:hypothetical protein [archaeon]
MDEETYIPPEIINEDNGVRPMAFIAPVLVAPGIFYTVGAVVQAVAVFELAVGLAVAAAVGATVYVGGGSESCDE